LNKNAILEFFSFIEIRKELIEQLFGFCFFSLWLMTRFFKIDSAVFVRFFKILRLGIKIRISLGASYFQRYAVYLQKADKGVLFICKIIGASDVL